MSGGGRIILRSAVAPVGGMDSVKERLSSWRRAKLEAILAKNVGDWTDHEFHVVLRCIAEAYDDTE